MARFLNNLDIFGDFYSFVRGVENKFPVLEAQLNAMDDFILCEEKKHEMTQFEEFAKNFKSIIARDAILLNPRMKTLFALLHFSIIEKFSLGMNYTEENILANAKPIDPQTKPEDQVHQRNLAEGQTAILACK